RACPASSVRAYARQSNMPRAVARKPPLFRRLFLRRPDKLVAHRDKLLGRTRMDADGLVEHPLLRAAFDRDRQPLDDLRRVGAQNVAAQYSVSLSIDDELHKGPLVAPRQGVLHRPEA